MPHTRFDFSTQRLSESLTVSRDYIFLEMHQAIVFGRDVYHLRAYRSGLRTL